MKRLFIILVLATVAAKITLAQPTRFSLATNVSVLRSFKKDQRYWAIGQTVFFHFHLTPKDGAYAWVSYFAEGKFTNDLQAQAKSVTTTPQVLDYENHARLRFRHISLGWRRYLKGSFDSEKWTLYGYAGFGLMFGSVINTHSVPIDSSKYDIPVRSGTANFKRLTFDLGLGAEMPVGGDVFLYIEAKALVPTTDYPSQFLFVNRNAPFTGSANAGLRILFN